MPVQVVQQKRQSEWNVCVDVCVVAMMWKLCGDGERRWRSRGEIDGLDLV